MTTDTHHSQHTPVDTARPEHAHRAPSPVLLGALAMALVAGGIAWYAQRDDARNARAPEVTLVEPPPAATVADEPVRPVARARAAERTRPAPALIDRAPRPLSGNPLPDYPRSALRAGEEATVMLRIAIDPQGVPTDVQVVQRSGARDRDFDRAAVGAVRQWRFEPALRDGKAVPASVQLPVQFRRG